MAYGICFNDSSCDISVEYDDSVAEKSPIKIISDINVFIKSEMTETFFQEDYSTDEIRISDKTNNLNKLTFKSKSLNILFYFTTGLYTSAYKTSTLLNAYMSLDDRAKILAFCLRYVAKVIIVD
jgi:hypothetical protein